MSGKVRMHKDRKARTAAVKQLAKDMKVSVRTIWDRKLVETTLESVKVRQEKAENAQKHRENCRKYAILVKNRQTTLKKAAFACGITERQMRRWVGVVEGEHEQSVGSSEADSNQVQGVRGDDTALQGGLPVHEGGEEGGVGG